MAKSVHNPIPVESRRVFAKLGLTVGLFVLVFLALPWSLEHKAHVLLHGLCAQRPSRTYMFGDRALPFDARMTGIYLGYLVTTISLVRVGAHRWCKPPTLTRIALLLVLGGVMVFDGFNSLLMDLELPNLYQPHNWLRVVTGMTAGMVLAVALCFLIASSLWREVDTRKQTLHLIHPLFASAGALIPLGLLIGSGFSWLYVPVTVTLIAAAALAISSLTLVLIVILTRQDFTFNSAADLGRVGTLAIVAGIAVILALSVGRQLLESITGPSTLT